MYEKNGRLRHPLSLLLRKIQLPLKRGAYGDMKFPRFLRKPGKWNEASFPFPPHPQTETQYSGFGLERKNKGA